MRKKNLDSRKDFFFSIAREINAKYNFAYQAKKKNSFGQTLRHRARNRDRRREKKKRDSVPGL